MSGVARGAASRRRRVWRRGARSKRALLTASELVHEPACLDRQSDRDRLLQGCREGPRAVGGDPNKFRRISWEFVGERG